jgi:hypothetical protein
MTVTVGVSGSGGGSGGGIGYGSGIAEWAKENNIPVEHFPANWNKFGKYAGFERNKRMAVDGRADCLIAVRKNNSPGTSNMISIMNQLNKPIYIKEV